MDSHGTAQSAVWMVYMLWKKQLSYLSKPSTQKDYIPSTQVAQMPCLFPQGRLSDENMLLQSIKANQPGKRSYKVRSIQKNT